MRWCWGRMEGVRGLEPRLVDSLEERIGVVVSHRLRLRLRLSLSHRLRFLR